MADGLYRRAQGAHGSPARPAHRDHDLLGTGDRGQRSEARDLDVLGPDPVRAAAEPVDAYVAKEGAVAATEGRKCLCNALLANVGQAQIRRTAPIERPLVTERRLAGRVHGQLALLVGGDRHDPLTEADKEKLLALGAYPDVGLAAARAKRDEARQRIAEGSDPSLERKRAVAAAAISAATTFEGVATEYIGKMEQEGKAEATICKSKWLLSLLAVLIWVSYLLVTKRARQGGGTVEYLLCMSAVAAVTLVPFMLLFTDEGVGTQVLPGVDTLTRKARA